MPYYLIAHQLSCPKGDYRDLERRIQKLGVWWRHLDCVWLVKNKGDAAAILESLAQYVDSADKLLVIEITRNWSSLNIPLTWLINHLS